MLTMEKDTWQPSLLKFSTSNKIKVISIHRLYHIKDLFFISLEFDKILNPSLFETKNLFNIHFHFCLSIKACLQAFSPFLMVTMLAEFTLHKIDRN